MRDFEDTVAEILLDNALDRALDYQIPEALQETISIGSRVKIPVKNSIRQGTVVALKATSSFSGKLLAIAEIVHDKPHMTEELFSLAKWMSNYYCTPLRAVLKIFLPPAVRGKSREKKQLFVTYTLSQNALSALCTDLRISFPMQAAVLDVMLQFPKGILLSELLEMAKTSQAPIKTLIKKKVLLCSHAPIDRTLLHDEEYFPTKPKKLNDEQQVTLEKIKASLEKGHFEVRLIHGVTGSGKTEVYLQAIQHALSFGKGVLFLVPEIALTSQMIEKLKGRFQEKIAILHHRLSDGMRFDAWHLIREGKTKIVVGARSAVFSPIQELGLIIVDEEHESSYKQTDFAPTYNARDVCVMRGKLTNATVLLGSATPSLESYHNALQGKYQLSSLKMRADSASLPRVTSIDMKVESEKNQGSALFSSRLIDGIKERMRIGEQVILFLNRRGYHTLQMCTACSFVMECPNCDVNLTFHFGDQILACHLCDYRLSPPPRSCPKCKADETLKFKGAGTEMVERALHAVLPEVRTLRLDADTTRHKGSHELLFKSFRAGKADVLIGTQMLAKGLHFPQVTLVGVINADASLQVPDFRSSEIVFQLLTQVAGRSGRGCLNGEVILQTRLSDHPVITLAQTQNFEEFFKQEIATRELFCYPPFTHLVKLTFSGKDRDLTEKTAMQQRATLISLLPSDSQILPVIACGRAKIKGEFRFQYLIKAKSMGSVLKALHTCRAPENQVRLLIDVDPLSTFF